jgi:hypothetical protein
MGRQYLDYTSSIVRQWTWIWGISVVPVINSAYRSRVGITYGLLSQRVGLSLVQWASESRVWAGEQIGESASMRLPNLHLSCRLIFGKAPRHTGLSALLEPRFGFLRLLTSPKAKTAFEKWGDLWMRWSHNTQTQSPSSHCRLTSPKGEWLFTDAQ